MTRAHWDALGGPVPARNATTDETIAEAVPREKLVRWLSILGLFLGSYGVLESVAIVVCQGSPFELQWSRWTLTQVHHLAASLILSAPTLLLIGSLACLRRNAWGRIVLLLYAWIWVVGLALTVVAECGDWASGTFGMRKLTWGQQLMWLLNLTDWAVYRSVLAVAVICLMTPAAMKKVFEHKGAGFEPILPASPR